jgi:serine/threonine protein phosphatase PrpC
MTELRGTSDLAHQFLAELLATSWDTPSLRAVDTLGAAIGTHPGQRRTRNEDRSLLAQIDCPSGQTYTVAAVCDGVGGSEMGDAAATTALVALVDQIAQLRHRLPARDLIVRLVRRMDDVIRDSLSGRGTTTASIWICSDDGDAAAVNVGDSRIFRWSAGRDLIQLSTDDTLENELKGLDIKDPTVLNVRGLKGSLSQALGQAGRTSADLHLNVIPKEQFGDAGLVLASDGIWKGSEGGLFAIAKHTSSPLELVRRALTLATWCGGLDNASIVALKDVSDRRLFAQHRKNLDGAAVVIAWYGDTKVVLRGRGWTVGEHVNLGVNAPAGASEGEPTRAPPKEQKKKDRRKSRKSDNKNRQLDLADPEAQLQRHGAARPKVEISTGNDSKSEDSTNED